MVGKKFEWDNYFLNDLNNGEIFFFKSDESQFFQKTMDVQRG